MNFSNPTRLHNASATRAAIREALPHHDVFHFSCHGMTDSEESLNNGLLMVNDEFLTLRDFLSMDGISARLAVLSACQTGVPGMKNADEVIGLPSGLVQAGAAGAAASLWAVSDRSTMMLMTRFYESWRKEGVEPPEALRQAQIWVRDSSRKDKLEFLARIETNGFGSAEASLGSRRDIRLIIKAENREDLDFSHPDHWAAFQYFGV